MRGVIVPIKPSWLNSFHFSKNINCTKKTIHRIELTNAIRQEKVQQASADDLACDNILIFLKSYPIPSVKLMFNKTWRMFRIVIIIIVITSSARCSLCLLLSCTSVCGMLISNVSQTLFSLRTRFFRVHAALTV